VLLQRQMGFAGELGGDGHLGLEEGGAFNMVLSW
jgi:hypothetical protein